MRIIKTENSYHVETLKSIIEYVPCVEYKLTEYGDIHLEYMDIDFVIEYDEDYDSITMTAEMDEELIISICYDNNIPKPKEVINTFLKLIFEENQAEEDMELECGGVIKLYHVKTSIFQNNYEVGILVEKVFGCYSDFGNSSIPF